MKPFTYISRRQKQNCTHYKVPFDRLHFSISCSGELEEPGDNSTDEDSGTVVVPTSSTCAFCKNNFPGITLNQLSVYPICDDCKINLDNRIFPLWVKLFFAGVLALVVFSIAWNMRFFLAYTDLRNSFNDAGSTIKAAYYTQKAADEVPEANDLAALANFYKGVNLLKADKSTEALAAFNKCQGLPEGFHLNLAILQAEMGSGFDRKDYNLFLKSSKAFLALDTTQSSSWGGVASAYACLYIQNKADTLKQQSLKYLTRARAIDDTSKDAKEFYGRILYRLDSKQIISKDEFDKKFPNGYTSTQIK